MLDVRLRSPAVAALAKAVGADGFGDGGPAAGAERIAALPLLGVARAGSLVDGFGRDMAALRVPLLLLIEGLRAAGRKAIAPAGTWGESLDLLAQCGADVCRTVEAETAGELAAHAAAPDVGAVILEPVTNSPGQRVFDPQQFWAALRRAMAVVVDVSQSPLQDVSSGAPPGAHLFIACSLTKWAAGGSQRHTSGLLIAHTDNRTIDDLLAARSIRRAAPARLEDAAWMDVDSTTSLRSRLLRYQSLLAQELHAAPVEVRHEPGSAYVLLLDQARTPGCAARNASAVLHHADACGLRIGRHGTFGMSAPAVSLVRGGTEYGLRLTAGAGPRSNARRLASALRRALDTMGHAEPG